MTDAAFLAALTQSPHDGELRAVYADFLDDAGRHDEAEVLRADEAMRRVPVWSDEYWTLKTRRNGLRRLCPGEWIRATRLDGSRPERLFRDGYPGATRDRWRFIRAYVEQWCGFELPDVGGHSEVSDAEERKLGLSFGPSLREYVAYRHDLYEWWRNGLVFGDHAHLARTPDGEAVAIWTEAPFACSAIALDRVGEDDPTVRLYLLADARTYVLSEGDSDITPLTDDTLSNADNEVPSFYLVRSGVRVDAVRAHFADWYDVTALGASPARLESDNGCLVKFGPPDARGESIVLVCLPPMLPWRSVPPSVWDFGREACTPAGRGLTDADRAELTKFFGDDPPPWFSCLTARRAAVARGDVGIDDTPF